MNYSKNEWVLSLIDMMYYILINCL
jgi:hypothetical protein